MTESTQDERKRAAFDVWEQARRERAAMPATTIGGFHIYTAVPDRWCFQCQRERPAVFCVICHHETMLIADIPPDKIQPRSRLGRIVDRFRALRMQRRR